MYTAQDLKKWLNPFTLSMTLPDLVHHTGFACYTDYGLDQEQFLNEA